MVFSRSQRKSLPSEACILPLETYKISLFAGIHRGSSVTDRPRMQEPVETRLIRKYSVSKLKLEELRKDREKEVASLNLRKPMINQRSRQIASNYILRKLKNLSPEALPKPYKRELGTGVQGKVRVVRVSLVEDFERVRDVCAERSMTFDEAVKGPGMRCSTGQLRQYEGEAGLISPVEDFAEGCHVPSILESYKPESASHNACPGLNSKRVRSKSPKVRTMSPKVTYTHLFQLKKEYSSHRNSLPIKPPKLSKPNLSPSKPLHPSPKALKQLSPFSVKISYSGGFASSKLGKDSSKN